MTVGSAPPPGFESESHRMQFAEHLWRGVVPPKFSYAGTSAYGQRALMATGGYRAVTDAVDLEVNVLRRHIGTVRGCQIAEIGPGTGSHTLRLMRGLRAGSDLRIRYLGLDFSATILSLASAELESDAAAASTFETWDIDRAPTDAIKRWRSSGNIITVMVGNTLANLDDPAQALRHIRASLTPGDAILVGVSLASDGIDPEKVIEPYRTPEFRATVLEPFRAAGVDVEDRDFSLVYRERELAAFITLRTAYQHERGILQPGRSIQCFRSRRFSVDMLSGVLAISGFEVLDVMVSEREDHAIVLAHV